MPKDCKTNPFLSAPYELLEPAFRARHLELMFNCGYVTRPPPHQGIMNLERTNRIWTSYGFGVGSPGLEMIQCNQQIFVYYMMT